MHKESRVAKRYAKSLLDFAIERGVLEEVRADMALIDGTCRASRDLVAMLRSPVIKLDVKAKALSKIFANKVNKITIEFVRIVAKKKRDEIIPEIAQAFAGVYLEFKGIQKAEVTTAIALTEAERKKVLKFIANISENVELREKIDPEIIGGFIIRVGDKQYDDSVASRLLNLKTELTKNPYIAKI